MATPTTNNLTANERLVISAIAHSEYNVHTRNESIWIRSVEAKTMTHEGVIGTIGSLVKKGLAKTWNYDKGQDVVCLTDVGIFLSEEIDVEDKADKDAENEAHAAEKAADLLAVPGFEAKHPALASMIRACCL